MALVGEKDITGGKRGGLGTGKQRLQTALTAGLRTVHNSSHLTAVPTGPIRVLLREGAELCPRRSASTGGSAAFPHLDKIAARRCQLELLPHPSKRPRICALHRGGSASPPSSAQKSPGEAERPLP